MPVQIDGWPHPLNLRNSALRTEPDGTQVSRLYEDRFGPTRPCAHCEQPVRHTLRQGVKSFVEADPRPAQPGDHGWHWNPGQGLGQHAGTCTELHHFHKCPTPTLKEPLMFATPKAAGEGVSNDALQNHLLLIKVVDKKIGMTTSAGISDALVTDIVELDTGTEHNDNLLFGKVLCSQLEVGQQYLGTIGKGIAQPGKSAPWLFTSAAEDQAALTLATAYLAKQVSAPVQTGPAAAWNTPPAAAPAAAPAAGAPPWAS